MMGLRIFRKEVEDGKLSLPPTLLKFFRGRVKVLGSNPLAVLCPAEMDLEEVEDHLRHLLLEVRKKLNGLESTYLTH